MSDHQIDLQVVHMSGRHSPSDVVRKSQKFDANPTLERNPFTSGKDSAMLTVKEVAHRWSVSPGMIYKLVAEGRLPCHRIGKSIRFVEDHLRDYLTEAEREPHPKQSFSHLDL